MTSVNGNESLTQWDKALGPQPTQAQLDAVTQADIDAAARTRLRSQAAALIDASDPSGERFRAFVLVMLDEINLIRSKLVPPLAARTTAQLTAAIRNKIDSGAAD